VVMADPSLGPILAVQLCEKYKFNSNCEGIYGITGTGSVVTQVVANADVGGLDGQVGYYYCSFERVADLIVPDALPELPRLMPAGAYLSTQLDQLVCQGKTFATSDAKEAERKAPESVAHL
jgi:hypothetical protein